MQDTLIKHLQTNVLNPWTSPTHLLDARIEHLSPRFETNKPLSYLFISNPPFIYSTYFTSTPPKKKQKNYHQKKRAQSPGIVWDTPPKTNMEPKNVGFEDDFQLPC